MAEKKGSWVRVAGARGYYGTGANDGYFLAPRGSHLPVTYDLIARRPAGPTAYSYPIIQEGVETLEEASEYVLLDQTVGVLGRGHNNPRRRGITGTRHSWIRMRNDHNLAPRFLQGRGENVGYYLDMRKIGGPLHGKPWGTMELVIWEPWIPGRRRGDWKVVATDINNLEEAEDAVRVDKAFRAFKPTKKNPWKESDRVKASPCHRCGGSGELEQFKHWHRGKCFKCLGTGGQTRDWRSDDPVDRFTLLGQPVRVYRVKGPLHILIRERDFQKHGKTPALSARMGQFSIPFIRHRDGSISPPRGQERLYVPWTVMVSALPQWDRLRAKVGYDEPLTREEKRLWAQMLRQEARLSNRLLDGLEDHYRAKKNPGRKARTPRRRRSWRR